MFQTCLLNGTTEMLASPKSMKVNAVDSYLLGEYFIRLTIEILTGTSEIQKLVIAGAVLKEYSK